MVFPLVPSPEWVPSSRAGSRSRRPSGRPAPVCKRARRSPAICKPSTRRTWQSPSRFFAGIVFPRHDARTTGVGWAIVRDALLDVTGLEPAALGEAYVAHGDLGDLTGTLLADRPPSGLTLTEADAFFAALASAARPKDRRALVRDLLARAGGLEARYLVKLLGSELRIGLKEAQVEDAIAAAFARPIAGVRRAGLLRGDVGEVAVLAKHDALASAALSLFHPIGFMLAQPLATPAELVDTCRRRSRSKTSTTASAPRPTSAAAASC